MRPFVVNVHDRLVFPSNFSADLDFSVLETLEQLAAVIRRDFEAKAWLPPWCGGVRARRYSAMPASRNVRTAGSVLRQTWVVRCVDPSAWPDR